MSTIDMGPPYYQALFGQKSASNGTTLLCIMLLSMHRKKENGYARFDQWKNRSVTKCQN